MGWVDSLENKKPNKKTQKNPFYKKYESEYKKARTWKTKVKKHNKLL